MTAAPTVPARDWQPQLAVCCCLDCWCTTRVASHTSLAHASLFGASPVRHHLSPTHFRLPPSPLTRSLPHSRLLSRQTTAAGEAAARARREALERKRGGKKNKGGGRTRAPAVLEEEPVRGPLRVLRLQGHGSAKLPDADASPHFGTESEHPDRGELRTPEAHVEEEVDVATLLNRIVLDDTAVKRLNHAQALTHTATCRHMPSHAVTCRHMPSRAVTCRHSSMRRRGPLTRARPHRRAAAHPRPHRRAAAYPRPHRLAAGNYPLRAPPFPSPPTTPTFTCS